MKGLIVLAAIVLCGCETRASDFRDEMEAKSSRSGLAVGRIGGSWLHVTPLGGGLLTEPKYQGSPENNLGPCRICPGWFSANGNRITWWNLQLLKQRAETTLSVTTITGEPVSTWTGDLYTPVAVALSQDGSKVALEVQRYDLDIPGSGLQYVTFGVEGHVLIEPQPPQSEANDSTSVGWSPDSRKIVYSRHGKVITVDIDRGERIELANGTNPAWSPDGHWISFTSVNRHAMLIGASDHKQVELFNGRTITGTIAWSPDSCCISFSDKGESAGDLFNQVSRMIVYRISDGAWFPVMHFFTGGDSTGYGWFYGYKRFLEINEANGAKAPRSGKTSPQ